MRRRLGWALACIAAYLVVAAAGVGIAALQARADVDRGVSLARSGIDRLGDGDSAGAAADLEAAAARLAAARDDLRKPWTWPARLVPVARPNTIALEVLAGEGAALAASAAEVAAQADIDDLRPRAGRVDLAAIADVQPALARAAARIEQAQARLARHDSFFLLGPIDDRYEQLQAMVDDEAGTSATSALGARLAPALLGGDAPRAYLLGFMTPAEMRARGGFIGSYGLLRAAGGQLTLDEFGSIGELIDESGARTLDAPADYVDRWARFRPHELPQDITLSPDYPTVAQVFASVYRQATGTAVDGVIMMDPIALAGLLQLAGPVAVDGLDAPLRADDAADFLLREQYTTAAFGELGAVNAVRRDVLEQIARATFEQLLAANLPGPRRIGDALGPAAREGRLLVRTFGGVDAGGDRDEEGVSGPAADEAELWWRLGVDGAFPAPGRDVLAVTAQNAGNNKIDVFLHRAIDYDLVYDRATGRGQGTVRVELRNEAPASGLPDAVIGQPDTAARPLGGDDPPGTNRMLVSLYTPWAVQSATIDGEPLGLLPQRELGVNAFTATVAVPPGGSVELVFEVDGRIDPGDYALAVYEQPMVNPDTFRAEVRGAGDQVIHSESRGP